MPSPPPSWLITGAGGQLGSILLRDLTESGQEAIGVTSPTGPRPYVGKTVALDLTDSAGLRAFIKDIRPAFIIHAAAVTSIQAAYENPEYAWRVNVDATADLTNCANRSSSRFIFISTDLVFDGSSAPYSESAPTTPLSYYGRTKAEAEQLALASRRNAVIRLPLMYGIAAAKRATTFLFQLEAIRDGRPLRLFLDEFRTPLYLVDAAKACIEIARSDYTGIIHAGGPERLSRYEMGVIAANSLSLGVRAEVQSSASNEQPRANLIAVSQNDVPSPEPRPKDVSLESTLFAQIFGHPPGRPMREAIRDMVQACVGRFSRVGRDS